MAEEDAPPEDENLESVDPDDLEDDLDDDLDADRETADPAASADADEDDEDSDEEPTPKAKKKGEGDDEDEDEPDPDDVEDDLDTILKDRIAAGDDEDEDDDEDDVAKRTTEKIVEPGVKVPPRQADEFVCDSCFLVKPNTQLADPKHNLCQDCV
jgi:hypothetical protein